MQAESSAYVVAVFVLAIVGLSCAKAFYLNNRTLHLFRALFPSWKFFEEISELPYLSYRVSRDAEDFSAWLPALQPPQLRSTTLLLNADGNLYLAYQALLQQLESDIADIEAGKQDDFVNSVSYQLVRNLVRFRIAEAEQPRPETRLRFQFQVSRVLQGAAKQGGEVFLTSAAEDY